MGYDFISQLATFHCVKVVPALYHSCNTISWNQQKIILWGLLWHHHILPLVALKGQGQGHSDCEGLYVVQSRCSHHMLL